MCALIWNGGDFVFTDCSLGSKLIYAYFFSWWYFAEPGNYVAREGEPVDGLCIILDGQVLVMLVLASLIYRDTFL